MDAHLMNYVAFKDEKFIGEYNNSGEMPLEATTIGAYWGIKAKGSKRPGGYDWYILNPGGLSPINDSDIPDWVRTWLLII